MSEKLSPAYWHDVNRYIGELLAGAVVDKQRFALAVAAEQQAGWTALHPDYINARLRKGSSGVFRPTRNWYHVLELTNPTPQGRTEEYAILFDPDKEVITKAGNGEAWQAPKRGPDPGLQDAWNLIEYIASHNRREREIHALGLFVPSPEDYVTLHAELQHGAAGKIPG